VSKLSPARRLALEATRRIRIRNAFARPVIEKVIDGSSASAEDRSFATLLTCGVVASTGVLDEIIDSCLDRPTDIQPDVRDALRISTYEMTYLDKTSYAAVSQGVELVRSVAPRAAGLANAVLRRISRHLADFPWGDVSTSDEALARAHAFPLWLVEKIIAQRGRPAVELMLEACDAQAPLYVATNPFRLTDADAADLLTQVDPQARSFGVAGCFEVPDASAVLRGPAVAHGRLIVADASAQCVAHLARPRTPGAFLEVASGRGTKSILLQGAALRGLGEPVDLFAVDLHAFKRDLLAKRMELCGIPRVVPVCADATDLEHCADLPGGFAAAFVDAPCSGTGTLRRHPEQRMRMREETFDELAGLGLRLLTSAASQVVPGGSLVYATCSVVCEENEQVLERFLSSKAGAAWEVAPFEDELPEAYAGCLTPEGYFQSLPVPAGPDGHFAARIVRTN